VPMKENAYLVIDLGGTYFRLATYIPSVQKITAIKKIETLNYLATRQDSQNNLEDKFINHLLLNMETYIEENSSFTFSKIGIAFAGPVSPQGVIHRAPTITGNLNIDLNLKKILKKKMQRDVVAINDVSAATWYFASSENEPFCAITVSSGIGNKVFYNNSILINDTGYGGEIGHYTCDHSENAPLCDCGGKGHLGAIASGRGVLAKVKLESAKSPEKFINSKLSALCPKAQDLTTHHIVQAILEDDPFTTDILDQTTAPLSEAIGLIYAAIGIRRYIIFGGFAQAIGTRYLSSLIKQIKRFALFGLNENQVETMFTLASEKEPCLIGMGIFLDRAEGV